MLSKPALALLSAAIKGQASLALSVEYRVPKSPALLRVHMDGLSLALAPAEHIDSAAYPALAEHLSGEFPWRVSLPRRELTGFLARAKRIGAEIVRLDVAEDGERLTLSACTESYTASRDVAGKPGPRGEFVESAGQWIAFGVENLAAMVRAEKGAEVEIAWSSGKLARVGGLYLTRVAGNVPTPDSWAPWRPASPEERIVAMIQNTEASGAGLGKGAWDAGGILGAYEQTRTSKYQKIRAENERAMNFLRYKFERGLGAFAVLPDGTTIVGKGMWTKGTVT